MEELCVYCNTPTETPPMHRKCRENQPCLLCGVSGLTFCCADEFCYRTVHFHCMERLLGPKFPVGSFCHVHTIKGAKDTKKLNKAREMSQNILGAEDLVYEAKSSISANCNGGVFWYIIGNMYFPSRGDLMVYPEWTGGEVQDFKLKGTVKKSIKDLVQSLEEVRGQNEAIWRSLRTPHCKFKEFKLGKGKSNNIKEEDLILSEIRLHGLKVINNKFLKTLENEEKTQEIMKLGNGNKKGNSRGVQRNDEFFCLVCKETDYEEDDLIVICSKCEMAVHMKCYGIRSISDSDWYCIACQIFPEIEERNSIKCALCPIVGGAVKPTLQETSSTISFPNYSYKGSPERVWCHIFCAKQIEINCIKNKSLVSSIDLSRINPQVFDMECSICGSSNGACTKCSHNKCEVLFHPECAIRANSGSLYQLFCIAHRPLKLRKIMESHCKRTVEDISAFSKFVKRNLYENEILPESENFTYRELYSLYEKVENLLPVIRDEQPQKFMIEYKKHRPKLRNKLDISRPFYYNIVDPETVYTKNLNIRGRSSDELFKIYSEDVFPILLQEAIILKEKKVLYVPKSKRKKKGTGMKKHNRDIKTEKLYCICKRPFLEQTVPLAYETDEEFTKRNYGNSMISCEKCEDWFHLVCVGLEKAQEIKTWVCPNCVLKISK